MRTSSWITNKARRRRRVAHTERRARAWTPAHPSRNSSCPAAAAPARRAHRGDHPRAPPSCYCRGACRLGLPANDRRPAPRGAQVEGPQARSRVVGREQAAPGTADALHAYSVRIFAALQVRVRHTPAHALRAVATLRWRWCGAHAARRSELTLTAPGSTPDRVGHSEQGVFEVGSTASFQRRANLPASAAAARRARQRGRRGACGWPRPAA